jgi:prefoldin subunit 5
MTEKETLKARLQEVTQEMKEIFDKVKEVREKIQELNDFEAKLRERFIFLEGRKSMLEEMLNQPEKGEANE